MCNSCAWNCASSRVRCGSTPVDTAAFVLANRCLPGRRRCVVCLLQSKAKAHVDDAEVDHADGDADAAAEPVVNKNKRYRKEKPWDHDGIEHWKIEVRPVAARVSVSQIVDFTAP